MFPTVQRGLHRDSTLRSTAAAWNRRHPRFSLAVESLEKREVLSKLSAFSPPHPAAAGHPANAVDSPPPDAAGFVPMFDGTNTAGWFIPYTYGRAVARNGQILLTGDKNFFLVTKQTYANFILTADVLIPVQGNSGLQFRSKTSLNSINGYQADVDTGNRNWAGGLWSQSRGWLARPAHRAPVVPGHWNHYEVEAIGNHIVITVNNKVTINTYNNLFTDGHIGLQDHGTSGAVYHFKDVEIENLGG
jgi:hypothetical protein